MGWQPNYQSEGRIYAKYMLEKYPNAKIGILSANDDFGRDSLKGFKDGLGDKAQGADHRRSDLREPATRRSIRRY